MCVLEGFHLFKMCLYIMDNFFVEILCLCIQPCLKTLSQCQIFRPWIQVVGWCKLAPVFEKNYDVWFTHVPKEKKCHLCSVGLWFCSLDFVFQYYHKTADLNMLKDRLFHHVQNIFAFSGFYCNDFNFAVFRPSRLWIITEETLYDKSILWPVLTVYSLSKRGKKQGQFF